MKQLKQLVHSVKYSVAAAGNQSVNPTLRNNCGVEIFCEADFGIRIASTLTD